MSLELLLDRRVLLQPVCSTTIYCKQLGTSTYHRSRKRPRKCRIGLSVRPIHTIVPSQHNPRMIGKAIPSQGSSQLYHDHGGQ